MSVELVLIIAVTLSSMIGSPLVQGIKSVYQLITNLPLGGKPALWLTVIVASVLGLASVAIAGYFSPPYPVDWQGWVMLIGGAIGGIFAAMTLVYKQLIAPPDSK